MGQARTAAYFREKHNVWFIIYSMYFVWFVQIANYKWTALFGLYVSLLSESSWLREDCMDWRWTRTFMVFALFYKLYSLSEKERRDISANMFYFNCIFNIPVLVWVEQLSQNCYFMEGEYFVTSFQLIWLLVFSLPALVESASIYIHTFECNWLLLFVTL